MSFLRSVIMSYKIGFLGLGNMGSAILNGILLNRLYKQDEIAFFAPSKDTQLKYQQKGISLLKDEKMLCQECQILILAIKPQIYQKVFTQIKDIDFYNKIVISLAPGKSISDLQKQFKGAHIARAMPNTPAKIGKATTTIACNDKEIEDLVKSIFSSIGTCVLLNEKWIDETIPLNGSMPAYLFEFAKSFIEEGQHVGLTEKEARKLVFSAIIGTCYLGLESDEPLDILIDQVCSKGGSTIAGLNVLIENHFSSTIKACFAACVKRSKELAKE